MNLFVAFVLGLLIGWLIEWVIDWIYWRWKIKEARQEAKANCHSQIAALEKVVASCQSQLSVLQAERAQADIRRAADPYYSVIRWRKSKESAQL